IIHCIAIKEWQFLQCSQFDEIQYGLSALKWHVHGTILCLVFTAHGYFRVLKYCFPDVMIHIIAHERFLRGAV
ncbi:cytoplasmic protein, partial [Salmonella enterica subsp. enterica serovar Thompson]